MCQESKSHFGSSVPHPHADFVQLCPIIKHHVRIVFRHYPVSEIEEAVAEAVGAAFVSYLHLKERGKDPVRDFSSAMATFAALHVRNDRHVGGRSSSRDVMSARAQRKRRIPAGVIISRETHLHRETLCAGSWLPSV